MTDRDPHDNVTGILPNAKNPVTQHSLLMRFSERLRDRDRNLRNAGGSDTQLQDPRDILTHVLALAGGMKSTGHVPPMSLVESLGAQVLALALSVARVEDQQFDKFDGDAA